MKKLYFLTLMTALAVPSFAISHRQSFAMKAAKARQAREVSRAESQSTPQWRAAEDNTYVWGEEWLLDTNNKYEYNSAGNVVLQLTTDEYGDVNRITSTWNEYGWCTSRLNEKSTDGSPFAQYEKKEFAYDPIVHSLVVSNCGYTWDNGAWVQNGNNFIRTVTRNDAGNITQVEVAILYNGQYDPTERCIVEYGPDGKANKITDMQLSYNGISYTWEKTVEITDIVWDRTDGQVVSVENLFSGANRIKSATFNDDGDVMKVEATYVPDSESYTTVTKSTATDGVVVADVTKTTRVDVLDAIGSYEIVDTEVYEYDGEREEYSYVEKLHYNAYGLETLIYAAFEEEGVEPDIWQWTVGTTTDDPQYGYPREYIIREYDPEEGEFFNSIRVEYLGYVDVAGTAVVETAPDTSAEYYNLQGIRVADPVSGVVYIERRGNVARKVRF